MREIFKDDKGGSLVTRRVRFAVIASCMAEKALKIKHRTCTSHVESSDKTIAKISQRAPNMRSNEKDIHNETQSAGDMRKYCKLQHRTHMRSIKYCKIHAKRRSARLEVAKVL